MTDWWQYTTSLLYGQPDSGNGGVENGVDFQTPFHTPITVLQGLGGIITGINKDPWGGTITIQTQTNVGNGPGIFSYYTHLDTFASGLSVGSTVKPGDLLGLSGGQVTGGNMPSGSYSTGPHVEFGFTNGPEFGHGNAYQTGPGVSSFLDPIPYLNNTLGLNIKDTQSSGSTTAGTGPGGPLSGIAGAISSLANTVGGLFSAQHMQQLLIITLAGILLIVGVVVLFKQGTNVQKTEVAS